MSSSLRINGRLIWAVTEAAPISSASAEPSFATHRLVDGRWVAKAGATVAPAAPTGPILSRKAPIGFQPPAGRRSAEAALASQGHAPMRCLGGRKEYLAAIRQAAGRALAKGTDAEAVAMISRGRLGGRKDNQSDLQWLLWRYERAAL